MFDGPEQTKQPEQPSTPTGGADAPKAISAPESSAGQQSHATLQKAFLDSDASASADQHTPAAQLPLELVPMLTFLQIPGGRASIDPNLLKDSPTFHFAAVKHTVGGKTYAEYSPANPPGLYGNKGKSFNLDKLDDPKPVAFREFTGSDMAAKVKDSHGQTVTRILLSYEGQMKDVKGDFFTFHARDRFDANAASRNFKGLRERIVEYDPHKDPTTERDVGPDLSLKGLPQSITTNVRRITIYKEVATSDTSTFNVLIEKFPEARKDPRSGTSVMAVIEADVKVGADGTTMDYPKAAKGVKYQHRVLSIAPKP